MVMLTTLMWPLLPDGTGSANFCSEMTWIAPVVGLLRLNFGLGEGRGLGVPPAGVDVRGGDRAIGLGEGGGRLVGLGAILAGLGERGGGGRMVGTGRFLSGIALSETGCSSAGRFLLTGSACDPLKGNWGGEKQVTLGEIGTNCLGVLWRLWTKDFGD